MQKSRRGARWVFKDGLQTDEKRISRGVFRGKSLALVEVDGVRRRVTDPKGR
jgi:hypothetical protein